MTYCGADLDNDTLESIVDDMGEVCVECRDDLKGCYTDFLKQLNERGFIVVKVK